MVHEERTPDTENGTQTGYWPGGLYTYTKKLHAPEEWRDKTAILEFEGVYMTAMVYVNGNLAATNLHGYSNFYVVLDKYLEYGQENEIKVVADNASEKNSRWYSGSGIYRKDVYKRQADRFTDSIIRRIYNIDDIHVGKYSEHFLRR